MARRVSWGTPFKSLHYLFPRGKWRFLVPSLLAGGGLLLLLLVAHLAGWRGPLAPGAVISAHANFESRCEECHKTGHGPSNTRCQRCHDASGAGRLTQSAHAFFGSADLKVAAAQPDLECARCHIEHRGREAALDAVDQAQCESCHFRAFSGHPEFAVLRRPSRETPGILFTHERHVKEVMKETGGSQKDTCVSCHEPQTATQPGRTPDMEPIVFDKHCASCHVKDDSIGIIDPITQEDVLGPEALEEQGLGSFDKGEFETTRGRISKVAVAHQDEWVLTNLRKLRRELFPDGYAAERGALLARQNQLERRLAQAMPLASESLEALQARAVTVDSEIAGLSGRLAAQAGAGSLAQGLSRVEDVAAAAAAAGDPADADPLKAKAAELAKVQGFLPAALPPGDHEARRQELLRALDAVESADPQLKARADDLRRRLAALRPGDTGAEALLRALEQRKTDRARLRDEIALREAGTEPPASSLLAAEQRAARDALRRVQARLALLDESPAPKANLGPEVLERKKQSVEVLTAPCAKCHVIKDAAFTRVVPANRVLVRSTFAHDPHLKQADCARCHAGVEKSKLSADLNFTGVASCQECHAPRATASTCATCHRYHPPVAP